MRVLVVHNAYLQRGGEEVVAESEATLLRANGHEVVEYRVSNAEVVGMGSASLAARTVFSVETARAVRRIIDSFCPEVLHAHNTFPLISPSVFWVANRSGVATVQTLHNFRLVCPAGLLLREGKVCERCIGRTPWPAIRFGCYRGSRLQSSAVAGMLVVHRVLGTYASRVQRFIALNEFCKGKFMEGGLPAEKIEVKPNFVPSEGDVPLNGVRAGGIFVGRLFPEKGLDVLAAAVEQVPTAHVDVVGQGPMEVRLAGRERIRCMGWREPREVHALMRQKAYLVLPSIWYETFGLVGVEAFASGLPVVASRIGALAELVRDGVTGLLFEPGSSQDLARKLAWADANPAAMAEMGRNARLEYERKYTAERNYEQLVAIYRQAIDAVGPTRRQIQ